jgi:hypothetical protein
MDSKWQPARTVPDDRIFVFTSRNLATYAVEEPLVGRMNNGVLEYNDRGTWRECGFPLLNWAEIPEMI